MDLSWLRCRRRNKWGKSNFNNLSLKFKCCKCDFCKRNVGDSSALGAVKITINLAEFSRAHGNLQKNKAKKERNYKRCFMGKMTSTSNSRN
jgi:galactose-1-phosphate uridylyltransferase